ncbi:receptor kinase-like protein Xa21 [Camellia sinensis]|uniref:receptor kinase-like protein Xa21 n=1 Tax=Camellia sinensis TaxID=4442 RepID=UPI0010363FA9|nr:receptor kinase-like protein Xa21 [Camellia sinensis]
MTPNLGSLKGLARFTVAHNLLRTVEAEGFSFLTSLTNYSNLQELDIGLKRFKGANQILGTIPEGIENLIGLRWLAISMNSITREIPVGIGKLKRLEDLHLFDNRISEGIPADLGNITQLGQLCEVPQEGVFRNMSAFPVVGNKKLCGSIKSLGLPACETPVPKKKGTSLAIKVAVLVAISCLILLVYLIGCLRRMKRLGRSSPTMLHVDEKFRKVSYVELLQATNKFSSSNLIGKEHYGSVYKGILGREGLTVVVKVLNLTEKEAAKSFVAECNALRGIRHRNLIKIITTCSSIDSKGDDFKAIVFEFMPNGNLEEWLHQSEDEQDH